MSSLIDMITAAVIFGVLTLTVARVQSNINTTMYQNQFNVITQTNAVEFARQVEWDFTKIGHHVLGQKVLVADSTEITFKGDLNNASVVNTVRYVVGTTSECSTTSCPSDFPIYRIQDGRSVKQNWGLVSFKISYYDQSENKIPTPITDVNRLAQIHSINVSFRLQSPEPVVSSLDTTWAAVAWDKTIIPRNLGDLAY